LKLSQVDVETRVLHVARLKVRLSMTTPLRGDELRAIGAWLKKTRPDEADRRDVLYQRAAQADAPIHRQSAFADLERRRSCPCLLIPHATPRQRLRLADQGADTRLIQDYLGHCNIQHAIRNTANNPARFEELAAVRSKGCLPS
jgi:type 1 fimbriae regulatory protein FimB